MARHATAPARAGALLVGAWRAAAERRGVSQKCDGTPHTFVLCAPPRRWQTHGAFPSSLSEARSRWVGETKRRTRSPMRHLSKLILACALSTGCATAVPQAQIDGTQKAISNASEVVGSQGGAAADRLADSKKEFDSAMEMAKAGKSDEARRTLEKAEADAKL